MRLWSLHPQYLDSAGLVACWREALLAKKVLQGRTRGYKNHPQLIRFRASRDPLDAIGTFLHGLYEEAMRRGYRFDAAKVGRRRLAGKISVSRGQIEYEAEHLRRKLRKRAPEAYSRFQKAGVIKTHKLFRRRAGRVELWEKV